MFSRSTESENSLEFYDTDLGFLKQEVHLDSDQFEDFFF